MLLVFLESGPHWVDMHEDIVLEELLDANEWPPCTKNFLERGGTVASIANAVFERVMQEDEWAGDGEHERTFGNEIAQLPVCRNDHEFGFVSGMCGYRRMSQVEYHALDGSTIELDPNEPRVPPWWFMPGTPSTCTLTQDA
ncbi:hypothetical protein AJ79_06552 [Helicocarpus griseus UAMH5409]|uniref:Uncharacterized protein n=1 Tax=Helicocarpus griseus UAMH5409 TaxID=1447875 RepID=A0A2B7XCJ7_9EURO|nr:hypothetical protein AJ79_06552 [Helicocarpus griseus UAMH5409]